MFNTLRLIFKSKKVTYDIAYPTAEMAKSRGITFTELVQQFRDQGYRYAGDASSIGIGQCYVMVKDGNQNT